MGKVGKYGNLYDRNGILLKRCNSKGILEKYTLKEVQDLVDKLGTEKDENGNIKDPVGFNNASYVLMQMYNDPKYNKEKENFIRDLNDRLRVDKEGVRRALTEGMEESEITESSVDSKSEDVQIPREDRVDKEWEIDNKSTKSYDVNDNKEEYVEYKES